VLTALPAPRFLEVFIGLPTERTKVADPFQVYGCAANFCQSWESINQCEGVEEGSEEFVVATRPLIETKSVPGAGSSRSP
jgi:hypothetical protein